MIFRYIREGRECIIVFSSIPCIVKMGYKNILKVIKLIDELERKGAKCYSVHTVELYVNEYEICFLCSEYSGSLSREFRQASCMVVSLQTTAIYTHAYYEEQSFSSINFSEQVEEQTDYLIVADYTADWISKRYGSWEKKLLRFGYPKLDTLYHAMRDDIDIPEEWEKRTAGKKVFLFMTSIMKKAWLEMFASNDEIVLIWRPHPLLIADAREKVRIEEISRNYNVIIDDMVSYYAAFRLSVAAIADPICSSTVNYLYMGKPLCIVDTKEQQRAVEIDYRQDMWYKSAYVATEDDDVLNFVRRVGRGENLIKEEQKEYYRYIQNNFDGQVCKRIYDYFDKMGNWRKV